MAGSLVQQKQKLNVLLEMRMSVEMDEWANNRGFSEIYIYIYINSPIKRDTGRHKNFCRNNLKGLCSIYICIININIVYVSKRNQKFRE